MAGGDDIRAALTRDVHQRRLPGVAVVGRRGDVDLDAGFVEREARERHVVLPADEPADAAETGLDGVQTAPVALSPHEALVVRRHELAVMEYKLAGGRVIEQRVVYRPRPLRLDLVHARDEPDTELLRGRADAALRRR